MGQNVLMLWLLIANLGLTPLMANDQGKVEPKKAGVAQHLPLSLVFAGDIMIHDQNYQHQPFSLMYKEVVPVVSAADLTFGNLEFPVLDSRPFSGYPLFNAHSDYVQAALDAGFDVFALANNHSADQVKTGISATWSAMNLLADKNSAQGKPLWFNGLRIPDEQANVLSAPLYRMVIIEKKGWRTGFVSVTEFLNLPRYGNHVQVMNWRDADRLKQFAEWIREQRKLVDVLVLGFHWGVEYAIRSEKSQIDAAATLVDAGVDILWGHHPHVLQPWYFLESPRGKALVMPSLGNFISAQAWYLDPSMSKDRRSFKGDSALFRTELTTDAQGKIDFAMIEPILIAHRRMVGGNLQVFTYRDLIRTAEKDWTDYFRARFELLSKFYPMSRDASLFFDGRAQERLRTFPDELWQDSQKP